MVTRQNGIPIRDNLVVYQASHPGFMFSCTPEPNLSAFVPSCTTTLSRTLSLSIFHKFDAHRPILAPLNERKTQLCYPAEASLTKVGLDQEVLAHLGAAEAHKCLYNPLAARNGFGYPVKYTQGRGKQYGHLQGSIENRRRLESPVGTICWGLS